jgi:fructose-1-phosphate kinase PfkB-like protein
VVIDAYGDVLKKIVELTNPWLIKPNLDELSELLGEQIEDKTPKIIKASRKLLGKTSMVLVSRGSKGAILVTKDNCFEGSIIGNKAKSIHTVGCGDYLLAGFLSEIENKPPYALAKGLKLAAARAWGWCEKTDWLEVESKIEVDVRVL